MWVGIPVVPESTTVSVEMVLAVLYDILVWLVAYCDPEDMFNDCSLGIYD